MKKLCYLFGIFCVLALLYSCKKDANVDKDLLYGKWKQGTLFEKYLSDGTGWTWDESDDVDESEAQKFEWTLEKADLTQVHLMEMGAKLPKYYTVTELTSSSLKYKDDYGKSYSFQKAD
jgi:hypothetical protein